MEIEQIKALLERITPGKWGWLKDSRFNSDESPYCTLTSSNGEDVISSCDGCDNLGERKEDCEFIAQAPQLVASLLERVENRQTIKTCSCESYKLVIKELESKVETYREGWVKELQFQIDNGAIECLGGVTASSWVDEKAERLMKEKEPK